MGWGNLQQYKQHEHADASRQEAERAAGLAREGHHVKACLLYERLIKGGAELPEHHYDLAISLAARGRHEEAIRHYRKALLLGYVPADTARVALARSLSGLQRDDEALATLAEACRETPDLAEGYLAMGDILVQQGKLAEAADSYRKASEADVQNCLAWRCWAQVLERLDHPQQASEQALRALACRADEAEAYDLLGRLIPSLPDPGYALKQLWNLVLAAQDINALGASSDMVIGLEQAQPSWIERQWEVVLDALQQGWADDERYPGILSTMLAALPDRTEALKSLHRLAPKANKAWLWLMLADWHEPGESAATTKDIMSALRADCADKGTHLRLKAYLSDERLLADKRERLVAEAEEILDQARDPDRQARGRLRWALTLRDLGREAERLLEAALSGDIQDATRAWVHEKWGRWTSDRQLALSHLIEAVRLGGEPLPLFQALEEADFPADGAQRIDQVMQERADPTLYLRWAEALHQRQERAGSPPGQAEQDRAVFDRLGTLVADSMRAEDHLDWGDLLARQGLTDEALRAYGRAAELGPDLGRPWLEMARIQQSLARFDAALESCAQAVEAEPDNADCYQLWMENLERAEAHALLQPLAQALSGPDISAARPADLNALEGIRRDHDNMLAAVVEQIEHNCDAPQADTYVNCGVTLDGMKRVSLALRLFQRATELQADNFWAWYDKGAMLRLLGRYEEAVQSHLRCQALDPDSFNAYYGLAMVHLGAHQYGEAIQAFEEAFERGANFSSSFGTDEQQRTYAYNDWTMALGEIKRYTEALEQNRLALCLNPQDTWSHFRRAYTLADMGLYDEARLEYEAAIRFHKDENGSNPYPHHNIADLLNIQGRYREARRRWREVIECYQRGLPDRILGRDSDYCLYYANSLATVREDWAGAERMLLTALDLNPEDLQVHSALAKHYLNRRKALETQRSMRLRDLLTDCVPASPAEEAGKHAGLLSVAGYCLGLRNTRFRRQEQLRQEQSRLYALAQTSYRRVLDMVERRLGPEGVRAASLLKDLGELHLVFDEPKLARDAFSQALKTDVISARSLRGLGEADLRLQDYASAQANLAAALRLGPHDLSIRLSYAQALAGGGRLEAAETEYGRILSEVPNHVDALVGLADVHVDMADKRSAEREDLFKEDLYQRAIIGFGKAIDLMDGGSEDRPVLIQTTLPSILYQRGYARLQLYQMRRWHLVDRNLRQEALKDFRACVQRDPTHQKAQQAVELLREASRQRRSRVERVVPFFIIAFAMIVFALAQWALLAGMTQTPPAVPAKEAASLVAAPSGSTTKSASPPGTASAQAAAGGPVLKALQGLDPKSFEDVGLYALLTFGSMLFMIAGAFLPQLTSLKLGSLQMEKSPGEALESVRGLGITGMAASGVGKTGG